MMNEHTQIPITQQGRLEQNRTDSHETTVGSRCKQALFLPEPLHLSVKDFLSSSIHQPFCKPPWVPAAGLVLEIMLAHEPAPDSDSRDNRPFSGWNGSLGTYGGNSGGSGIPREALLELGFKGVAGCPVAPRTLRLQSALLVNSLEQEE